MDFINKITQDTLIICNSRHKNSLLKEINKNTLLLNIKFMTIEELKRKIYFDYDINTIYYLINKYKFKYDVAKMYLNNLYYIENKKYKSNKLNKLVELKNELDKENLLIYDDLFGQYLLNVNIIVFGYDYLTKDQKGLLEEIEKITKVSIIDNDNNNNSYIPNVYELNTLEEEVSFVADKISELLNKGIDINKIKITNVSKDYYNTIIKIFNFYKIPINLNNKVSIYETEVGKFFIDNIKENIKDTIDLLNDNFKYEENLINKIVNICNKYINYNNFLLLKEILINELKNNFIDSELYKNAVEVIFLNDIITDEYVFLMNFNQTSIPIIKKDEEYITDNIKDEVDLDKTYEINKMIKQTTINNILRIKNLIITYKLKDLKSTYYPSNLINNLKLNVIHPEKGNIVYSKLAKEIELTKKLDNLLKYNIKDNDINILYSNLDHDLYRTYDNKFDGIDKRSFYDYIDNKLTLSYSSMENYNECAFKYYINNILKLNQFEETFFTIIGNVFHHILEIGLFNEIDVEKEVKLYLKDKTFTNKETFFLNKLTKELIFILDIIRKQTKEILLNKYLFEEEIVISKGTNLNVIFKGYVDKIIYSDDIKKIAVLIDYKTGNPEIDLSYVPFGLKMQLPIYLYLVNNKLKNVTYAGFYLQKILNSETSIGNKTLEEQKENDLKLQGYSNSDIHILSSFDKNYENSNLVSGLKIKQDGELYSSVKSLNNEQINKLIEITDQEIDKCINSIENVNFSVNPKRIGYSQKGFNACTYCTFKDLCFKIDKNYQDFDKIEDLTFLD